MFIDVHCHLEFYSEDKIREIISNAKKINVKKIITNGVSPSTNRTSLELSKEYSEVFSALGIYPIEAISMSKEQIEKEIKFIKENKNKIMAIGEVGLDLHEDSENLEKQKEVFRKFIELSIEIKKPLIIHSRKAEKECIEILEEYPKAKAVMHCFSGNKNLIKAASGKGYFFSIPAIVRYSEHFQNLVKMVPAEQLFCETDSPFLHPLKQKNNEPKNVIESYKKIAEIKNIPLKKLEKQIEKNYDLLFT